MDTVIIMMDNRKKNASSKHVDGKIMIQFGSFGKKIILIATSCFGEVNFSVRVCGSCPAVKQDVYASLSLLSDHK